MSLIQVEDLGEINAISIELEDGSTKRFTGAALCAFMTAEGPKVVTSQIDDRRILDHLSILLLNALEATDAELHKEGKHEG